MWPTDLRFRSKSAERRFESLKQLVESIDVLPTTARTAMRILELHRDPKSSLDHFGDALSADPALATRVISLANSVWAGQGNKVVRITEAIKIIGINNLMPLLFGVSLAGLFNRADVAPSQREEIWRTSLLKAVVARFAAEQQGLSLKEEAFLCALFQDIGLPIMLACDKAASVEMIAGMTQSTAAVLSRERELFGVTHADVSRAVAARLKIPELFSNSAGTHHDANGPRLDPAYAAIAPALRLAASLPHRPIPAAPLVGENFSETIKTVTPTLAREQPEFVPLVLKEYQALLSFLGANKAGTDIQFREFLQEVCQRVANTLTGAIEHSAQTVSQLQSRVSELEQKQAEADIDPLTGLLHRAAIVSRSQELLRSAAQHGWHVAIAFADVDDFKLINQNHGRDCGDAVLRAFGRALKDSIGQSGAVGRFGADEFVFVLSGESEGQLQSACELAQSVLFGQTCRVGEKSFPVTFSTGLHVIGVPAAGVLFEQEVRKSAALLSAARKAGRNRWMTADQLAKAA